MTEYPQGNQLIFDTRAKTYQISLCFDMLFKRLLKNGDDAIFSELFFLMLQAK